MDKEALKTDSNLSSMRIMFARVVNVSLFLAGIALGSYILGEFIFNKKLDLIAMTALVATLLTIAFGGKSVQSFSERPPRSTK